MSHNHGQYVNTIVVVWIYLITHDPIKFVGSVSLLSYIINPIGRGPGVSVTRGNVLIIGPPGLEFRILYLYGTDSSDSSGHHHLSILLSQYSLYVHKGDLNPYSFIYPNNQPVSSIINVLG